MDFKHNFTKDDIFNIFDPPPKMTNVIFFLMKASLIRDIPEVTAPPSKGSEAALPSSAG